MVVIVVVVVALSSLAKILGECSTILSPPVPIFFFFGGGGWKIARGHEFHSLYQKQSTMAQRAKTTVAEYSLTNGV